MAVSSTPSAAPSSRPTATALQQSFPLVALLQLATFCAALGACVDGAKFGAQLDRLTQWGWPEWGAFSGAIALGGMLGFFVGLGQQKMWRSAWGGGAVGAVCGVAILAVYVAPAPAIRALAAAAVLLLTTIMVRLRSA